MILNRKLRRQAEKLHGKDRDELVYKTAVNQASERAIDYWQGLMMYSLHEEFGWGATLMKRLNDRMNEVADCIVKGTITMDEIIKFVECNFDEGKMEK